MKCRYEKRSDSPGLTAPRRTIRSENMFAFGTYPSPGESVCHVYQGKLFRQTLVVVNNVDPEIRADPVFHTEELFQMAHGYRSRTLQVPFRLSVAYESLVPVAFFPDAIFPETIKSNKMIKIEQ